MNLSISLLGDEEGTFTGRVECIHRRAAFKKKENKEEKDSGGCYTIVVLSYPLLERHFSGVGSRSNQPMVNSLFEQAS